MRRDPWLWGAMIAGLVLRGLPLWIWGGGRCVRDECSYKKLATAIADGQGLLPKDGWLWAPGYPYLLAFFRETTGSIYDVKVLQVALAVATVALLYAVALRVFDRRTARITAWMFALHPTQAFFAGTLWSESAYTSLLVGAVLALLWAREGAWPRALAPGALVGLCVLFRGVATYMGPVFVLAALWGAPRDRWRHAAALLLAVALVVAPYSVHASARHGGFLVSDATLGQMMYLGNNAFPPVTFDWGNGWNRDHVVDRWSARHGGRPHCDTKLPAVAWDACEVENGKRWILANPAAFAARVPLRVAQLVNPHSFLTRHLRWAKWAGLPWVVKEGLALAVVAASGLVLIGGTAGAAARARGPYGLLAVGIVAYHVAAVALVAGLTRYRVPLEPLWMVFAAALLADPRGTLGALRGWRLLAAILSLGALIPLMLWFLPSGLPGAW